jgi:hypothetical protein
MFQYHHPKNLLLKLSRVIPVPFHSVYGFESGPPERRERATWWQWRGRILRHRRAMVA